MPLQTHAVFFSAESKQKVPLDPQVFVAQAGAQSDVGPQGIRHAAGLRNALVSDMHSLPITTATGMPLNISLGQWLLAKGDVLVDQVPDGREKITVVMSGLIAGGHYSLFENHFDQMPVGFTPLDGKGVDNNFVADATGHAVFTTYSPTPLTHDNAVLVVFHSDGKHHGNSRGDIGLTAHHQLIARP